MKVLMIGTVKTETTGGMATHTQELVENLRSLDFEVIYYKTNPYKNYFKMLDFLVKFFLRTIVLFFKIIKDSRKVDIVHVQSSGPMGGFLPAITASVLKIILKYNLVVTFHYSKTEYFLKKYDKIFSFVLEKCERFIVVSYKQRDLINSLIGMDFEKKIEVIPNGFNPKKMKVIDKEEARDKLNINIDDFVLVNVGLLLEKKGQKYLVKSMHHLVNKKNYVNFKCFIIGQGPLFKKLNGQIKRYNLENNVTLTGFLSLEKLNLFLNSADIFVLPSLKEGNPIVMFEALSLGLPFVGTSVGGIPEIISSEEFGFVIDPKNPQQLSKKIIEANIKEWDYRKIREYGKTFTWNNIAKETIKLYKNIVNYK